MSKGITYLVTTERIIQGCGILYENVSFPTWELISTDYYKVYHKNMEFYVHCNQCVLTDRLTTLNNVDPIYHEYLRKADDTEDYVKALKQVGIDITNAGPHFRDGVNPNRVESNEEESDT